MTKGYVLFRLGSQMFAARLDDVREIVRLGDLTTLPGMRPPVAGVTTVRGVPLPVVDVRAASEGHARGDVLVVSVGGDAVGVAVDQVHAVVAPDELSDSGAKSRSLPSYVTDVRRHLGAAVFVVDLSRLLDVPAADWPELLTEVSAG